MTTYVYDFSEGSKEQLDLLGGKGANLAEMTRLGLPVPPGFTISTDACRAYLAEGREPDGLADEVSTIEVCARLTRWVTEPLLSRKLSSPLYDAVIACWATDRFDTVIEAWPPVAELTGWLPMTVDPSMNVIVPLGLPAPGATTETAAVNVTGWPNTDGEPEVVTTVLVAALLTVCPISGELLVRTFSVSVR